MNRFALLLAALAPSAASALAQMPPALISPGDEALLILSATRVISGMPYTADYVMVRGAP